MQRVRRDASSTARGPRQRQRRHEHIQADKAEADKLIRAPRIEQHLHHADDGQPGFQRPPGDFLPAPLHQHNHECDCRNDGFICPNQHLPVLILERQEVPADIVHLFVKFLKRRRVY